ncbi:MAG: PhoH family protein [Prevotellaceae bacterium]|jgi:phosphate starvation-inducible PhoH-like protein|nr:PhoH family protein [Prevotellaceae bacterium]
MTEKIIEIKGLEPVDIYGANNVFFNLIAAKYPELKIVARGNIIKLSGLEGDINDFESKFTALVEYLENYGAVNYSAIDHIYSSEKPMLNSDDNIILFGNGGRVIKAKTYNQQRLVELYEKNDLLFATGPAGSGKTYTAIALAVRALKNREVKRIILTRPAVEAGERLGFLPGDMKEKLDPYLQPLYDALNDMIPPRKLQSYVEDGTVQIAPLAYMRGRTLDNAFVILDEAQNTTLSQIKMFLTRMGNNAKFIVTGDITQIDLPRKSDSGLPQAMRLLKDIENIASIEFDISDIVRHRLVKQIVEAFDRYDLGNVSK